MHFRLFVVVVCVCIDVCVCACEVQEGLDRDEDALHQRGEEDEGQWDADDGVDDGKALSRVG